MAEAGAPHERRHNQPDPIAKLSQGESLAAATRYDAAFDALTEGITAAKSTREALDIQANTQDIDLILDCLYYSRADTARVQAALAIARHTPADHFFVAARADLHLLHRHLLREPAFDEPFTAPPEDLLINNALAYLSHRTCGMLELAGALARPYDSQLTILANAHGNLVRADAALVAGIMLETPLLPPVLPTDPTQQVPYHAELLRLTSQRRARRRGLDPQLAYTLQVTETLLNRRGQHFAAPRRRLPPVFLPNLALPGPKITEIFDVTT